MSEYNMPEGANDSQHETGSLIEAEEPVHVLCGTALGMRLRGSGMMSYFVQVLVGGVWHQERIDGAGDMRGACAIILQEGLFTSNEDGPIWYPPHRIKAVTLASTETS